MDKNLQAIILAAGKSTRFNTDKTKLAEKICGQAMILFPTKLLEMLCISTTVVVGYQQDIVRNIIIAEHEETIDFVVQEEQVGTGHALMCTKPLWRQDHILVINGDVPLITSEVISSLYAEHIKKNAAISFVTSRSSDEMISSYGRVLNIKGTLTIVEAKDFIGNVDEPCDINAGIYLIKKDFLEHSIALLQNNNVSSEFYITDLVAIASQCGLAVATINVPFNIVRGINTFAELCTVEQIKRMELINYWMNRGVRFLFPDHVHLDMSVSIGSGSYIGNNVHLEGNTSLGKNCTIKEFSSLCNVTVEDNVTINAHCVISDVLIQSGASVGPFAHLRSNTTIEKDSVIGNFVEIKNSVIGKETKAKHLSYIGDSVIGMQVNVGAGTVICNYDGINKNETVIKDYAFIGSNNTIVAPVTIGSNAFTAAGSTITTDVPDNALAIARAYQTNKHGYAEKLKGQMLHSVNITEQKMDNFSFIGARIIASDTPADKQ